MDSRNEPAWQRLSSLPLDAPDTLKLSLKDIARFLPADINSLIRRARGRARGKNWRLQGKLAALFRDFDSHDIVKTYYRGELLLVRVYRSAPLAPLAAASRPAPTELRLTVDPLKLKLQVK